MDNADDDDSMDCETELCKWCQKPWEMCECAE